MKECVLISWLLVFLLLSVVTAEVTKKRITNIDDLPRYSYDIETTVSALLDDDAAFAAFAAQVGADVEKSLAEYDIEDKTTACSYYATLFDIAVLDREYDEARRLIEVMRELQDKPTIKYMTGLVGGSIVRALQDVGTDDSVLYRKTFSHYLSEAVAQLPWDVVQEQVEELKGRTDMVSENLIRGSIETSLEPVVEKTGQLSSDFAREVIALRYVVDYQLPLKSEIVTVLDQYIRQNRVEKVDIWREREVNLTGEENLHPVVIAIWDTGVDTTIFPNNLWVNTAEHIDGRDDDGNGFVDDVHGIAYNVDYKKTPELLYTIEDTQTAVSTLKDMMKGYFDVQAAIESPEASALRQKMATMEPEDLAPFIEGLVQYALYIHGTHVAGIAIRGNPAARIMPVRFEVDYHVMPPAPTVEDAHQAARMYREIINYYRTNNVRVVNMSWIGTIRETERALEMNGIGETPEQRAQLAREIYDITKDTIYELIKNTPEILYVNGAGNENDDVSFEDYYPTSFDLPNILVAGAVDQAGDETSFTSFGERVDIYANGYEVVSYVPGGDSMPASGTSMSSPQAANLAAKLFALEPSLTPVETIDLIIQGADESPDGRFLLMNPQHSVMLLKEHKRK
jgi:subtilisin family serine protease